MGSVFSSISRARKSRPLLESFSSRETRVVHGQNQENETVETAVTLPGKGKGKYIPLMVQIVMLSREKSGGRGSTQQAEVDYSFRERRHLKSEHQGDLTLSDGHVIHNVFKNELSTDPPHLKGRYIVDEQTEIYFGDERYPKTWRITLLQPGDTFSINIKCRFPAWQSHVKGTILTLYAIPLERVHGLLTARLHGSDDLAALISIFLCGDAITAAKERRQLHKKMEMEGHEYKNTPLLCAYGLKSEAQSRRLRSCVPGIT